MKDNTVITDTISDDSYYMLMFRMDIVGELEGATDPEYDIKRFVKKYPEIVKYYGKIELGETTSKKHYQMVLWTTYKTTTKDKNKLRKYWTDKFGKGTCAITDARKKTLPSYCNKDEGQLITNLTREEKERIPKWVKTEEKKLSFEKQIDRLASGRNKEQFAYAILELCREHNRRPNRNMINYYLWKHRLIDNVDILMDWKVINSYHIEEYEETITNI
jgi:hypothetical protein